MIRCDQCRFWIDCRSFRDMAGIYWTVVGIGKVCSGPVIHAGRFTLESDGCEFGERAGGSPLAQDSDTPTRL